MAEISNPSVMAESVGVVSVSHLGGADSLRALSVAVFPAEQRAIVWATLVDSSLHGQLAAVEAFASVREYYEDELELELRFGAPTGPSAERVATREMVLS